MSLDEVQTAAADADAATLLHALREHVDDPKEPPPPAGGNSTPGGAGDKVVPGPGGPHYVHKDLATQIQEQVEQAEKASETIEQWLERDIAETQAKIDQLSDATFTIINLMSVRSSQQKRDGT